MSDSRENLLPSEDTSTSSEISTDTDPSLDPVKSLLDEFVVNLRDTLKILQDTIVSTLNSGVNENQDTLQAILNSFQNNIDHIQDVVANLYANIQDLTRDKPNDPDLINQLQASVNKDIDTLRNDIDESLKNLGDIFKELDNPTDMIRSLSSSLVDVKSSLNTLQTNLLEELSKVLGQLVDEIAEEARSRSDSFDVVSCQSVITNFTSTMTLPMPNDNEPNVFNLDDLDTISNFSYDSNVTNSSNWCEQVIDALHAHFDIIDAVQMISYLASLDQEESPEWKGLRMSRRNSDMFRAYVIRYIKPKADIFDLLEGNLARLREYLPEPDYKSLIEYKGIDHSRWVKGGTLTIMAIVLRSAIVAGKTLRPWSLSLITARQLALDLDLFITSAALPLVGVGAGIFVIEAAYIVIIKWLIRKEIDGLEAAKQVGNALASTSAATIGSIAGGIIGLTITGGSPIGMVVGGGLGGVIFALGWELSKKLYEHFFCMAQEKALEGAYKFMQLQPTASNIAILASYKALAKIYHPDKGGKAENFKKLVTAYLLIKASRGEGENPSEVTS
uniref:J domain-containing protein n=1 Tax=Acrobeloides nanus TaxID=290746 RepID=A0A914DZK6_9BILA